MPTFYLGALLTPAANLAVGYKALEIGFTPAKDFGSAHGKSIGHDVCDKTIDGLFTAASRVKSYMKSNVIPGAKSAMHKMKLAALALSI